MMKKIKALFKRRPSQNAMDALRKQVAQLSEDNARLNALWSETTVGLLAEEAKARTLESANRDIARALDRVESQRKSRTLELQTAREDINILKRALHSAESELAIKSAPDSALRAFVMSLRVHEMQGNGATGYGVTAFIPTGVIRTLDQKDPATQQQFVQIIAAELVSRAMHGIHFINSRGTRCALVFDPLAGGAAGTVFDTPTGPEMKLARSNGVATNNLQLLSQHPEAQEKFHKSISRAEALDNPQGAEAAWLANQVNRSDVIQQLIEGGKLPREAGE
jgi:polyhydroxyalkanoate synthesis regulator phasin